MDGLLVFIWVFGDKELKEYMSLKLDVVDVVVDLLCEFLVLGSNGLFFMYDN